MKLNGGGGGASKSVIPTEIPVNVNDILFDFVDKNNQNIKNSSRSTRLKPAIKRTASVFGLRQKSNRRVHPKGGARRSKKSRKYK